MTVARDFVPVVIVGGGPTGVATAIALAQHGVGTLVLERWADLYPQPRAVHLDDEVFRLIAGLGIAAEFAAISRPALGLQFRDRAMSVLAQFDRDRTESSNGFPQANMFDQPELERLLRSNLSNYPNAELRTNAEVIEAVQIGPERARVTFTDRTSGLEQQIETRYVLGCDGANSVVRTAIGATMAELKFQQRWLVVDVATEADLGQWDGVQQICDAHRAATYMRIGPGRYRWEFRLLPGESSDDFSTLSSLQPLIGPWVNNVAAEHLELIRVAEYTFRAQVADRWRRGRMFILGDAAHLTPPFIGQGLCAGLRDATNLGWKLAGVINEQLPETVLDTYEAERKPHVRHLIRFALAVGAAMTAGGNAGDLLRRLAMPRLHLIPGVRTKILDSTTPALRSSALVVKSRGRHQLAGRLCPNTVLAGGERLDEAVGCRFAVITAVALSCSQREAVDRRGGLVVTASPGTDLAHWLRSGRATVAVVRPDRTVLIAGRDTEAVLSALPTFGGVPQHQRRQPTNPAMERTGM